MTQSKAIEILLLILRKTTPSTVLQQVLRNLTLDRWRGLLEVANYQGLLPFLYERLQQSFSQECVPDTIQGGPFEGYQAIFDTHLDGSERVPLVDQTSAWAANAGTDTITNGQTNKVVTSFGAYQVG